MAVQRSIGLRGYSTVEISSRRRPDPTAASEEDGTRAAPDTVYIIHPGKNLTIFHGMPLLGERAVVFDEPGGASGASETIFGEWDPQEGTRGR